MNICWNLSPCIKQQFFMKTAAYQTKTTYLIGNFKIETNFLLISMHLGFMEPYKPKQTVYQTSTEWSLWVYSLEDFYVNILQSLSIKLLTS